MNYILITKPSDFKKIIDSAIFITGEMSRQDDEIQENMWAFSLDDQMAKTLGVDDLSKFVEKLIEQRKKQLSGKPATFYLWLDEVVGQIRFNLLSGHRNPPFGCKLN